MTTQPKTVTIIVLTLAAAAMLSACHQPDNAASGAPKAAGASLSGGAPVAKKPNAAPDKVMVYYFHGTRRCTTCLGIQDTIEQTIADRFSKETAAGMLSFEEINIDEEADKHFVEQYQISFSTMIVAAQSGATTVKWEAGEKVWEYAQDQPALKAYVEKMVRTYLNLLGGN